VRILKFFSPRQSADFDQGSAVSPRPWMLFSVRADGQVSQSDAFYGPPWSVKK